MQNYFQVNYTEDQQGEITEIRVCIVEGDHVGTERVFNGPNAVAQLQSWAAKYPQITSYSTDNFLDQKRMVRVREFLFG